MRTSREKQTNFFLRGQESRQPLDEQTHILQRFGDHVSRRRVQGENDGLGLTERSANAGSSDKVERAEMNSPRQEVIIGNIARTRRIGSRGASVIAFFSRRHVSSKDFGKVRSRRAK
jgi:hypothetical protein